MERKKKTERRRGKERKLPLALIQTRELCFSYGNSNMATYPK